MNGTSIGVTSEQWHAEEREEWGDCAGERREGAQGGSIRGLYDNDSDSLKQGVGPCFSVLSQDCCVGMYSGQQIDRKSRCV